VYDGVYGHRSDRSDRVTVDALAIEPRAGVIPIVTPTRHEAPPRKGTPRIHYIEIIGKFYGAA